jgi:hypothetical protein
VRAGSHRRSGDLATAATALVAAVVTLLAAQPPQPGVPGRTGGTPTATVVPGVATVVPAPPQSFSRPADASRPLVPASAPQLVEAPSIGLRAAVTAYSAAEVAANGGAVKPATLWTVAWWTGGGTPGTHTDNTVYLYGHTWREPAVFNRVEELEPGAVVRVTTRTGCLDYVVDGSFTVEKTKLDEHPTVTAAVPGRLVLIGCHRETGREEHTTRNIVVTAHLEDT